MTGPEILEVGDSEMLESKTYFIENRNQQIAYKKYGLQGEETIVFQHGLASKKEDWDSPDIKGMTYIEFFVNKGYRCISIDCLSHGESSIPAEAANYDRNLLALDIISVMDAEAVEQAHLVGYSMGGLLGCCVAKFYPHRLLSLMLGGHCPGVGTAEEIQRLDVGKLTFDKALEIFGDEGKENAWLLQYPKDQLPAIRNIYDKMEEVEGLEAAVADLNVPVLLWVGEEEPFIFGKGKMLAKQHGWDFFSVEGDHIGGFLNTGSVLPQLFKFLTKNSCN
ncbi:MAG: alpha/beta fold hydrolase [Deltaproteobacteria bacterium]